MTGQSGRLFCKYKNGVSALAIVICFFMLASVAAPVIIFFFGGGKTVFEGKEQI